MHVFSYQTSQFRYVLEGLGVENFALFYGHLVYTFIVIWYILLSFRRMVYIHLPPLCIIEKDKESTYF
jgi:hypothetical protein